jgi:hypothetical protein
VDSARETPVSTAYTREIEEGSIGMTQAPVEPELKRQVGEALIVFLLTYGSAVVILIMNKEGNVFALALLPTLATLYSNLGFIKKTVQKITGR